MYTAMFSLYSKTSNDKRTYLSLHLQVWSPESEVVLFGELLFSLGDSAESVDAHGILIDNQIEILLRSDVEDAIGRRLRSQIETVLLLLHRLHWYASVEA